MTLFWLLCVILVLGGWAVRPERQVFWEDVRLRLFGVRVRVPSPRRPPRIDRHAAPSPRHDFLPPPQVGTRSGP
jgi:hypothetical protein